MYCKNDEKSESTSHSNRRPEVASGICEPKLKDENKVRKNSEENDERISISPIRAVARAFVRSTIRDNYGTRTLCSLEGVEKVQTGINVKPGRLVTTDREGRSPVYASPCRSRSTTK